MQQRKTLGVSDITHAAFLMARGHKIEKIDRENNGVVRWHFDDTYNLVSKDVRDFINGDAWGDCKKFAESYRVLKQTIRTAV